MMYVGDLTGLGAVVAEQFVPFGLCFMRAEISEVKNMSQGTDSTGFLRVQICGMAVAVTDSVVFSRSQG